LASTILPEKKSVDKTASSSLEAMPISEVLRCSGGIITDDDTGLSLMCPENLTMYVTENKYNEYFDKQEKTILLCESPVEYIAENSMYQCLSGGITIYANGDGWGGGCNPEWKSTLLVDSGQRSFCLFDTGFSQVYFGE